MFQEHGYGICEDGPYTLEPLCQQYLKVRENLFTSIYCIAIPIKVKRELTERKKMLLSTRPNYRGNSILLLERYGILTSIIHLTLSALVEDIRYQAHMTINRKKQIKATFLTSERTHLNFPIHSCSVCKTSYRGLDHIKS